jgi:flagellar protein FlbT
MRSIERPVGQLTACSHQCPLAIDRRCRIRSRKACNETVACVGKILFTILVNSGTRTSFLIDGDAPILRERDTITAETANTPAKRLYLCLQTMYLKNDIPRYRTAYQGFLRGLRDAGPGARVTIDAANAHVTAGALYKALKEIRKLVKRQDELLAA